MYENNALLYSTEWVTIFQDWAPTFWYVHFHSSWGHMRCIRSGSSLIWVMNYHWFSALFLPSLSSVSPPTFLMKSDFTKWETFKFLCFENNFCSGSGLEWETCLTPASSNAVLSQVPIRMLVACIVAVGIFSVTTGAGQDTCSGPDLLAFQPYPEHITEEVIYFPVNHLELSGLLMMCGWYWELFGCLLAMSSQWHCVVYLKSLHTWTGSWCRSLKNVKV